MPLWDFKMYFYLYYTATDSVHSLCSSQFRVIAVCDATHFDLQTGFVNRIQRRVYKYPLPLFSSIAALKRTERNTVAVTQLMLLTEFWTQFKSVFVWPLTQSKLKKCCPKRPELVTKIYALHRFLWHLKAPYTLMHYNKQPIPTQSYTVCTFYLR
jgi:hypothetical protein